MILAIWLDDLSGKNYGEDYVPLITVSLFGLAVLLTCFAGYCRNLIWGTK